MKFAKNFFLRPPLEVARDLLGSKLITVNHQGLTSGMIVEVEAYSPEEPASHSFRGMTKRNKIMFSEGGFCYVYLIYGMHYCVNVVTEGEGVGSAVLIRALAPLDGTEIMHKRRKVSKLKDLTNGPGKLCQALAINRAYDGEDLRTSSKIYLEPSKKIPDSKICFSTRIGIQKAKELDWRIFIKESEFVSRFST